MRSRPLLTICVPTRNRQRYFIEVARSLVSNLRTDIQFVFADNSEDPSILLDFMKDLVGDPRVVFLPCGNPSYSMQDNWERCLEAADGEWVTYIGDDDYLDPDLADLIGTILKTRPDMDAISWSRPVFFWPPHDRPFPLTIGVTLGDRVFEVPRSLLWRRQFLWEDTAFGMPLCRYSVYHGAVSRRLLLQMKSRFGGRFFEYPVVDLENNIKVLSLGRNFFYSERPFSVAGICAESNSQSWGNAKAIKLSAEKFKKEEQRNFDKEDHLADFPFPAYLGNSIVFAQTQLWFKHKYRVDFSGWEENFAKTCAEYCSHLNSKDDFDDISEEFRACFARWKDGAYLPYFDLKEYKDSKNLLRFTGRDKRILLGEKDSTVYMAETIADVQTAPELFAVVRDMVPRISQLNFDHLGVAVETVPKPKRSRRSR